MLMGSRTTAIMKVMIFSINTDKFTGFFDKFLKNNVQINDCNQKGYHTNLSAPHSDMAAKKVFGKPRICPQQPAFAQGVDGRPGFVPGALASRVGKASFINRL